MFIEEKGLWSKWRRTVGFINPISVIDIEVSISNVV